MRMGRGSRGGKTVEGGSAVDASVFALWPWWSGRVGVPWPARSAGVHRCVCTLQRGLETGLDVRTPGGRLLGS
jgi:hypothetical protein